MAELCGFALLKNLFFEDSVKYIVAFKIVW